jgi:hypothetical protein
MRHRLFHAIVVVGAASGCASTVQETSNPPAPDAIATDTAVQLDTATTETAVTDSAPADSALDTAKAPETGADTCVDEGCGCMPCIK